MRRYLLFSHLTVFQVLRVSISSPFLLPFEKMSVCGARPMILTFQSFPKASKLCDSGCTTSALQRVSVMPLRAHLATKQWTFCWALSSRAGAQRLRSLGKCCGWCPGSGEDFWNGLIFMPRVKMTNGPLDLLVWADLRFWKDILGIVDIDWLLGLHFTKTRRILKDEKVNFIILQFPWRQCDLRISAVN